MNLRNESSIPPIFAYLFKCKLIFVSNWKSIIYLELISKQISKLKSFWRSYFKKIWILELWTNRRDCPSRVDPMEANHTKVNCRSTAGSGMKCDVRPLRLRSLAYYVIYIEFCCRHCHRLSSFVWSDICECNPKSFGRSIQITVRLESLWPVLRTSSPTIRTRLRFVVIIALTIGLYTNSSAISLNVGWGLMRKNGTKLHLLSNQIFHSSNH